MAFRFSDLAAALLACAALANPVHAMDVPTNAPAAVPGGMRGLWIWKTEDLLGSPARQTELAQVARIVGITDLFLYMNPALYADRQTDLTRFIGAMSKAGLKVWASDGCRCYLSDAQGPARYLAGIDALVSYNNQAAPWARFAGFHADIEPHDLPDYRASFHNGIATSKLSQTDGGVWKATAAQDREALLEDWLAISAQAAARLHAHHLRFAAAMPWWTQDYEGEPLTVNQKGLAQAMMELVDDYVIMGYHTDPHIAAAHVAKQAQIASAMPAAHRPRVSAAMETHRDVGAGISYADTPGKASKGVVLADMAIIQADLARFPAFAGVSIEDWTGFHDLPR